MVKSESKPRERVKQEIEIHKWEAERPKAVGTTEIKK